MPTFALCSISNTLPTTKTNGDAVNEIKKVSAWTEAERERPRDPDDMRPQRAKCQHPAHYPLGYDKERKNSVCIDHEPVAERPDIPPWIMYFLPETVIEHSGWEAVVRHVGFEGGHWLVLIEPTKAVGDAPRKAGDRAEFRRLKHEVGKKKAWEIMRASRRND